MWQGIQDLTLRAGFSQGFRVPSLQDKYIISTVAEPLRSPLEKGAQADEAWFSGLDRADAVRLREEILHTNKEKMLAWKPLLERLAQRIVDGERNGLEADLDEAMTQKPPLAIINENLLAGMKTVGELSHNDELKYRVYAVPVGVIAGLIPSTNPTSTCRSARSETSCRSTWKPTAPS